MICKKCGYELSDDYSFCPMCGRAVVKKHAKKQRGTYATVNDDTDKMWLYDGSFWGLQLLVPINLDAHTFAVTDVPYDLAETGNTTLKGKIIPKGGKNLHGMPVDSICIDAVFDDDPNGGLIWRYSGIRYQGFTE